MNKDDIKALLAKYDYPVPRYTSFPTAVQFKPVQDAGTYFDCLNKITPGVAWSVSAEGTVLSQQLKDFDAAGKTI